MVRAGVYMRDFGHNAERQCFIRLDIYISKLPTNFNILFNFKYMLAKSKYTFSKVNKILLL
jgi:hypothetical protein